MVGHHITQRLIAGLATDQVSSRESVLDLLKGFSFPPSKFSFFRLVVVEVYKFGKMEKKVLIVFFNIQGNDRIFTAQFLLRFF